MADTSHLADDLLDDAVDGRLSASQQKAFAEHLAVCPRCRAAYQAVVWTRREVHRVGQAPVPEGLLTGIRDLLDREDGEKKAKRERVEPARASWWWARPAVVGALATAVVILAAALWWARPPSLPRLIAGDLQAVGSGSLALTIESNRIPEVEDHLAERLGFRTPVYDLSEMGYHVVGGRAHLLSGRPSALSAYEGKGGDRLICQMFPGGIGELPAPMERVTRGGVEFLIYERGEATVVMWQSGPIVCALAGRATRDEMLRMAVAKAA